MPHSLDIHFRIFLLFFHFFARTNGVLFAVRVFSCRFKEFRWFKCLKNRNEQQTFHQLFTDIYIYNIYTDTHAHTIAQCKLLTLDIKLVHSIVGANNYEYLIFFSPIPFFSLCHSLIKIWKRNIHITHCAIVRQKKTYNGNDQN